MLVTTLLPFILKHPAYGLRIESYGSLVGEEHIRNSWLIGTTPEDCIKYIECYIKLGFRNMYVISSSPYKRKTIEMYSHYVILYIKSTYEYRIIKRYPFVWLFCRDNVLCSRLISD